MVVDPAVVIPDDAIVLPGSRLSAGLRQRFWDRPDLDSRLHRLIDVSRRGPEDDHWSDADALRRWRWRWMN